MDSVNCCTGFAKLAWLHKVLLGFCLLVSHPFCSFACLKSEHLNDSDFSRLRQGGGGWQDTQLSRGDGWHRTHSSQVSNKPSATWNGIRFHVPAGIYRPDHPDLETLAAVQATCLPVIFSKSHPHFSGFFFLLSALFVNIFH